VRCHQALAPAAAAAAHAGTGHATATCLDCHMPRTVMGIDRFVRTHRISSPVNRKMIAAGAPNACNLCHLDRSTRWTAAELAIDLPAVRLAVDAPAGELWLGSREPAVRLVAAAAVARSPLGRTFLDRLLRGLDDPLAHVRAWTMFAVEDVVGHRIAFDPRAAPDVRRAQLAALRTELSR
jgi:hypothetical protein